MPNIYSNSVIHIFKILTSCLFLAACIPSNQNLNVLRGHAGFENAQALVWPDPNNIPVCWESGERPEQPAKPASTSHVYEFKGSVAAKTNPGVTDTVDYKKHVQEHVTSEMKRAGLNLTGWGPCLPDSKGIRASTGKRAGYGNFAVGLGKEIDGVAFGLNLDHSAAEFSDWKMCAKDPLSCIKTVGLHEFGHAVGLAHEHDRVDYENLKAASCKKFPEATYIRAMLGDYDPLSIMNYCRTHEALEGLSTPLTLSAGDIKTLQTYYGFQGNAALEIKNNVAAASPKPLAFLQETSLDRTKIEISVFGRDIDKYKYVFGPASINCNSPAIYGQESPASQKIVIDLSKSQVQSGKVCVVGGKNNIWQSFDRYTVLPIAEKRADIKFSWFDAAKFSYPNDLPSSEYLDATIDVFFAIAANIPNESLVFEYKVGSNVDCKTAEGYKALPSQTQKSWDTINLASFPDGPIQICAIANAKDGSKRSYTEATFAKFVKKSPQVVTQPKP